jgi:hypothetical protein
MLVGAQFNQNLYASGVRTLGGGTKSIPKLSDESLADLEQKLKALKPQFVRVFFSPFQDKGPPSTRDSFVRTVQLAQAAGATINITVQSVEPYVHDPPYVHNPDLGMNEFAAVLEELVRSQGCTNVRWVTLQNEPNTPPGSEKINPPLLKSMYESLDKALGDLRSQIRFMAGDLIEGADPKKEYPPSEPLPPAFNDIGSDWRGFSNQGYWVKWMQNNMDDIVDAYSIHIYWDAYSDISPKPKFLTRLETIRRKGKPFYVTEFGVRGNDPHGPHGPPGTLHDGTPVQRSKLAAFQHAWFQIVAAQLGCAGTAKWDAYQATYDATPQSFYTIAGPVQNTWDRYPTHDLLQLFTTTTEPGWQAASVPGVEPWAAVAEFRSGTDLAIVGLDTRWAMRNDDSQQQSSFTVPTRLARGTQLAFLVWNHGGEGRISRRAAVTVGAQGQITIDVPQQGVFALTTRQLDSV